MRGGITSALGAQPGRTRYSRRDKPILASLTVTGAINSPLSDITCRSVNSSTFVQSNSSFLNYGFGLTTTPSVACGFYLITADNASSGTTVRISPSVVWSANSYNTTDTLSKTNAIEAYVRPITGAITSGTWTLANRTINGNADATVLMQVASSGAVSIPGTLAVTGATTLTGLATLNGGIATTPQALSGAGSVSVSTLTTALTSTTGLQSLTLADGVNGQIKTIVHDVAGGSMILTPTTKTGFTSISFTSAGNTATLQFFSTRGWMILATYGATVT